MKTIIIATDFSPAASNAAEYGAEMASAIGANLLLVHVYQLPISYLEVPVVINPKHYREELETEILQLKRRLTGRIPDHLTITTEIKEGSFYPELKTICEDVEPYAVVMGSQGTTAAERVLFGSHAVHTMKNLRWPVVTIPSDVRYKSIRKIGVACDLEQVRKTVPMDEIRQIVSDFGAELHILNLGKQTTFKPGMTFESGVLAEELAALNPQFHFITGADIDDLIIDFAGTNGLDMLMVIPKRHNLVEKLLNRSLTKKMVLHSQIPVMALHQ
ncbi:MAG: universal stress protein [Chitinophagaceae bacterium]